MASETLPTPALEPASSAGPPRRRRFFTKRFLVLSIAVHLLLGAGAAIWVVQTSHPVARRSFHPVATVHSSAAAPLLAHKVQLRQRDAMSAPVAVRHVTTSSPSKLALPAMPIMPAQPTAASPISRLGGMGGVGAGLTSGGSSAPAGFANASGAIFMASIGGLNVQARRLAVALDVSGSVAQYQQELQTYVTKTFKGSEVGTFTWAGFKLAASKSGSVGTVLLEFLNSPSNFDSIYVFSDFGETRGQQTALPEVQRLIRAKKVRLYLHVLREPGEERTIKPVLQGVIEFARSTGGNVIVGGMAHP